MKIIKTILFSLIVFFVSAVNVHAVNPSTALKVNLTVAAAANLRAVLEELKTAFEKDSAVTLKIITGSSGKLAAQIENGAPFDIFLSADMKYPQTLYQGGFAKRLPQVYAYGILVLWTMKEIDLSAGVSILNNPAIKKIAVANPDLSPYGREAVNVMKFYQLTSGINSKLVYGESIAQTNAFITSRSADLGFTSKSTLLDPHLKERGAWIEIPSESYAPLAQGAVILKHAAKNNPDAARQFYLFLFSPAARAIFKQYGYQTG